MEKYRGVGTLQMEKLSRCGNSVDGKIMEVWELWRWKIDGGVGTLEMAQLWRCRNSADGQMHGGVGTLQMNTFMEVWELQMDKFMEVQELRRLKNYGGGVSIYVKEIR